MSLTSSSQRFQNTCACIIIALVLLNNVALSLTSTLDIKAPDSDDKHSKASPQQTKADEEGVDDDILGLGKTIFIVICVVAGLVVLGIAIACCFCFACLCFSSRRKSSNKTNIIVRQNQASGYPNQPNRSGVPESNYDNGIYTPQQPYSNASYYNNDNHYNHSTDNNVVPVPFENNYNNSANPPNYGHQYTNASYQKSSPPSHQDPYASIDRASAADPNLILERFKPTVPPKPLAKDRIPGWTAVTAEVKKRTQLNKLQKSPYDGYSNDGYDGYDGEFDSQIGSPVPPPAPPQPDYNEKSTTDNFMY